MGDDLILQYIKMLERLETKGRQRLQPGLRALLWLRCLLNQCCGWSWPAPRRYIATHHLQGYIKLPIQFVSDRSLTRQFPSLRSGAVVELHKDGASTGRRTEGILAAGRCAGLKHNTHNCDVQYRIEIPSVKISAGAADRWQAAICANKNTLMFAAPATAATAA